MPKNSGETPAKAGDEGRFFGRAEPAGGGVRITRIVRDWRAAGEADDFSNPAGLGALTCPEGLLDFEVSLVDASCGHQWAVL